MCVLGCDWLTRCLSVQCNLLAQTGDRPLLCPFTASACLVLGYAEVGLQGWDATAPTISGMLATPFPESGPKMRTNARTME